MNQDTQEVIAKLSQLSQQEREIALSAILNRFCVCCGVEGDFTVSACDCPSHVEPIPLLVADDAGKWPIFAFNEAEVDWASKRLY